MKNKDGEAWAENVPGELLEVMNIYQSGDANENIPFHVRMMEDVYILNYKDSLLYLRCPEAGENGKAAGKLRKIMELQSGRTVAGVLIRKVRAREENIWQIRELYRHVRKLAVPGQKVQIIDGMLYVDGIPEESEIYDKMEDAGIAENEIVLGADEYFVLGDNRNSSEDSRSGNIGPVGRETIYGKAWFHLSGGGDGMGFVE